MLFECSLYSSIHYIDLINQYLIIHKYKKRLFIRTEIVLYSSAHKLIISEILTKSTIKIRDKPELNKNMKTICRKINTYNIISGDKDLLLEFGYKKQCRVKLKVVEYVLGSVCMEFIKKIGKDIEKEEKNDNDEEKGGDDEKEEVEEEEGLDIRYLVHLYTITTNTDEGERMIENVVSQMKGMIDFFKPDFAWFD